MTARSEAGVMEFMRLIHGATRYCIIHNTSLESPMEKNTIVEKENLLKH